MDKDTRTEYEKLLGYIDYVKWLYYDDESITEAIFTLGEFSRDLTLARTNYLITEQEADLLEDTILDLYQEIKIDIG